MRWRHSGSRRRKRAAMTSRGLSSPGSVTLAADGGARAADEKVEIDATVGLLHRIAVEPYPAAMRMGRRGFPLRAALREFVVRHVEMQAPRVHVELDEIAIAYERERTAGGGFRCRVKHDRSICSARHPRIGDPHHVGDAALQDL